MIILNGISKSFGNCPALRDLSLRVEAGDVVALIGPNGAGKSTALRILAGVIRPDRGGATINGRDVVADDEARRFVGYLPQKLGVPLTTTVMDLARLVARVRGVDLAVVLTALEETGLTHRARAPLAELSGGQKQRVMLTLATLGPVTSLLLDEPSINLDVDGSEEVRGLIRSARNRGHAVLFASHHLSDVAVLADRLVVLVDGRVIAQGTMPELAACAGVTWNGPAEVLVEMVYRTLIARTRSSGVPVHPPFCQLVGEKPGTRVRGAA